MTLNPKCTVRCKTSASFHVSVPTLQTLSMAHHLSAQPMLEILLQTRLKSGHIPFRATIGHAHSHGVAQRLCEKSALLPGGSR